MASVDVSLADATHGRLPLVSVRSGRAADGRLPVDVRDRGPRWGWVAHIPIVGALVNALIPKPAVTVRLPLTDREFARWARLERTRRSAPMFTVAAIGGAFGFARFPGLLVLGLVIAVLSFAIGVAARWSLDRFVPTVVVDPRRRVARLSRVHPAFVAAVGD